MIRSISIIACASTKDSASMTFLARSSQYFKLSDIYIILLMYAEITKELLAFYAKYAKDTGLNIQEVKKMADSFASIE
jgi:hypothetical protein